MRKRRIWPIHAFRPNRRYLRQSMKTFFPRALGRPLIASAIALSLVSASAGVAVGLARAPRQDTQLRSIPASHRHGPRYVSGEVLVHFRRGRAPSDAAAIGARGIHSLSVDGWKLLRLRGGESVDHAVARLRSDPRVDGVTPNHVYESLGVPSDTLFPVQWGLQNTGQPVLGVAGTAGADISAVSAWDTTTGSSSVIAAVADSGVNSAHPDLAPNMIAGQNFVPGRPSTSTYDAFGHGSHVAGIIGARGNDEYGVTGVAQRVSIMPIRVLDDTSHIANGFNWAATHGAKVVNGSFGGPDDDPVLKAAIQGNPNTLFVVAAGNASSNNDNVPEFPCNDSLSNLICVAASDQNDHLASFSNFGPGHVHLAAPGVNIVSTYMPDPAGDGGSGYALSDSPAGGYANNANNWAQWGSVVDPKGKTNCNLNYRLRAGLAPNDIFTAQTAPQSDPTNWTDVDTAGGPSGYTTTGNYVSRAPAVAADGLPFLFRFHLVTDAAQRSDGVYVDNVSVTCAPSTTLLGNVSFGSSLSGFTTGGTPNTWGTTSIAYIWVYMSGTSMASPMVAGAAALLWAAHPNATVAGVKEAILQGVDQLPAFASTTFSGGRLNVDKALQIIDATPPTGVALTNPTASFQLATTFSVDWTATDGTGTGVKNFDVRYERAPYNGHFTPWATWKSNYTGTGAPFPGSAGNTYCFEVRARDNVGNLSNWTGARCTDVPVNDTALTAGPGWSRVKSSTRYLGDDTYSATKGATLTLASSFFRRMDLVVSVCNGCGSVAVFFGSTSLGTFSLNSTTFQTRQLVFVHSYSHISGPQTVTIRIVSPSGHPVMIEGLGLLDY